jgi:hypothetical protein
MQGFEPQNFPNDTRSTFTSPHTTRDTHRLDMQRVLFLDSASETPIYALCRPASMRGTSSVPLRWTPRVIFHSTLTPSWSMCQLFRFRGSIPPPPPNPSLTHSLTHPFYSKPFSTVITWSHFRLWMRCGKQRKAEKETHRHLPAVFPCWHYIAVSRMTAPATACPNNEPLLIMCKYTCSDCSYI